MKKRIQNVTAIGPASSANLGSGFDCFAIALNNIFDTVKISLNNKTNRNNNLNRLCNICNKVISPKFKLSKIQSVS